MKLEQIEIENFRCFEHLTVVLDPEVNAFIGINASGKTAILDAIAISLNRVIKGDTDLDGHRDPIAMRMSDVRIRSGLPDNPNKYAQVVKLVAVARGLPHFNNADSEASETSPIQWTETVSWLPPAELEYLSPEDLGYVPMPSELEISTQWRGPAGEATSYFHGLEFQASLASPNLSAPFPVVAYYRAHRRFSQMPNLGDIFKLRLGRESAYKSAMDAAADYGAMCRWFYMRENQELRERDRHRDQPDLRLPDLEAIRAVLPQMLDQVTRVFFDDNPPRLKVEMKDAKGLFTQLEVEQLSDGYRNLLAVALDFARRLALANPILAKPLEAPGILLIDEIELHLHPKWQQTVIPRLRAAFPNTQIIVTTHSPLVLTSLHARQIRIVRDQQVFAAPIETYGADALRTARLVMDTQSRPPDNPNTLRLGELFDLINRDQVEDAAAVLAELEATLGAEDPALVDARTSIENRRWQQEMGL